MLNSETQKNYPELFTKSDPKDGQVEYLDNNCFGSTVHQYYNIVYNIGPYILLIIFRFGPVEWLEHMYWTWWTNPCKKLQYCKYMQRSDNWTDNMRTNYYVTYNFDY